MMLTRIVSLLAGSAFVLTISGLGAALIWQRLPPMEFKVPDLILCPLGLADLDSECVQAEISRIRDDAAQLEFERDALAQMQEEADRRRLELEELSAKVESFNLFTKTETSIGVISTGVRFASILTPERWVEAWCYWTGPGSGAVSAHLDLGRKSPGQAITWNEVSNAQLAELGLTVGELTEARLGCRFPDDPK